MKPNQIATTSLLGNWGKLLLVMSLGLFLTGTNPARATGTFIFTINQIENDVVVTGSGTIDTTALTFVGPATEAYAVMQPSSGTLTAVSGIHNTDLVYSGVSLISYGPGVVATSASFGSGDYVGIASSNSVGYIAVPTGYVSGSALSDSATWSATTLADLGITLGTYVSTWGAGSTASSLTITVSAVPEPTPTLALTLAALGLALFAWRSRRSSV